MTTQIELTPEQRQKLEVLAKQYQKSVETLIAEAVEQMLQSHFQPSWEERKQRALSVVGKFPAEADLSARHDAYLAESER
ncbi:MAG: Spy/CpxP family protein refolding chaperone [Armatimonadota bacterium]